MSLRFEAQAEHTLEGLTYVVGEIALDISRARTRWQVRVRRDTVVLGLATANLADAQSRKALLRSVRELDPDELTDLDRILIALDARLPGDWQEHLRWRAAELKALAPQRPAGNEQAEAYEVTPGGIVWNRMTRDGPIPTPVTNFLAKIVSDVLEDDGSGEVQRAYEMEGEHAGRVRTFRVALPEYRAMNRPAQQLGARAAVYPGMGIRDHASFAIPFLSGEIPERRVFTHTGWRHVDGAQVYLHGGGAIGAAGALEGIETRLEGVLSRFAFPDIPAGDDLRDAVHASLSMLDVGPLRVTAPAYAAAHRAVLGKAADYSVHYVGPTGTFKSAYAALAMQHFGAGFDALHLPASWSSTPNALEGLAFTMKDALLVVDDFAPTGGMADVQRAHSMADRVLRAQGNNSGRMRMRADLTVRAPRPPRGLVLSTGEDIPRGQSLRARIFTVEVSPGDIDPAKLTAAQGNGRVGRFAQSMGAFIAWVAEHFEEIQAELADALREMRETMAAGRTHPRNPDTVANLATGMRIFLRFAVEVGALDSDAAAARMESIWTALTEVSAAQSRHQAAGDPPLHFLRLLSNAIAAGRAHIANPDGGAPSVSAEAWGWREVRVGTGDNERHEWREQGNRVGWVEGTQVYLLPDAALGAAQTLGQQVGDPLAITSRTLHKRLSERGLLSSTDTARETLTVRKTVEAKRMDVLHIRASLILGEPDQPDPPGTFGATSDSDSDGRWSGARHLGEKPDHEPDHGIADSESESDRDGQVGRVGRVSGVPAGAREASKRWTG